MSIVKTWFQSTPTLSPSWLPPSESSPSALSHSQSPRQLSSRTEDATSFHDEDLLHATARGEANVQKQLQRFLDAQSEGLGPGVRARNADIQRSDVRSPVGSSRLLSPRVIPIRQPVKESISLRAARRGIRDGMIELGIIKDQELEAYDDKVRRRSIELQHINEWEERRQALEKEIDHISSSDSQNRIKSLREDDRALQEQINSIGLQLARLKDQQNAIQRELSRVTNSVDSKLSSYRQSLKLVDRQVEDFLRQPNLPASESKSPYLALPIKRRTLQMAREYTSDEKRLLQGQRQTLAEQREAIKEGLTVWQDVMRSVGQFERSLRRGLGSPNLEETASTSSRSSSISRSKEPLSTGDLIQQMDDIIIDLDSKIRLAETRGWKLLICCIGAELEAFQQGREILRKTSELATQISTPEENSDYAPSEAREVQGNSFEASENSLYKSDATVTRSLATNPRPPRTYSDEEPDSDLLVSRDTDTETD